jgi:hypothetical protein
MDNEPETAPQSPRGQLRGRLHEMRELLIDRLAEQITGGELALLGNVGAALAALAHDV